MDEEKVVDVPIRVECNPTEGGEGQQWDVVDIIDVYNGWSLGCLPACKIAPSRGFPDGLAEAVINALLEAGRVADNEFVRYSVILEVYDGCEMLADFHRIIARRGDKFVTTGRNTLDSFFTLTELGFEQEDPFLPNGDFHLALDFGNLYLKAGSRLNANFIPVVTVWGTYYTGRTLTEIKIELPAEIASREHLLALLTFFLFRKVGREFVPMHHSELLAEGRLLEHLLPAQFRN